LQEWPKPQGVLVCASKGKKGEVPVYRIDTALVATALGVLRQEVEEEHRRGIEKQEEESKVSIAAILNAGRERMRAIRARQIAEGRPLYDENGIGAWEVNE
jgi:hypothetical protein